MYTHAHPYICTHTHAHTKHAQLLQWWNWPRPRLTTVLNTLMDQILTCLSESNWKFRSLYSHLPLSSKPLHFICYLWSHLDFRKKSNTSWHILIYTLPLRPGYSLNQEHNIYSCAQKLWTTTKGEWMYFYNKYRVIGSTLVWRAMKTALLFLIVLRGNLPTGSWFLASHFPGWVTEEGGDPDSHPGVLLVSSSHWRLMCEL